MKNPFKKITIIGCGLIGSSLARAIRARGAADKIICADASADICARATALDIADQVTSDLPQAVTGADLVVLCVPVGAMGGVAAVIAPHLAPGCIVSDTGSVKETVLDALEKNLPDHVRIVPAHPVAGTENAGPESGFATLFENRWCILTPGRAATGDSVQRLTELWCAFGARVEVMDAARHDRTLAATSHLPHLIAYTMVDTAARMEADTQAEIIKFSAGGFRDFTRIAASDPVMWRDIFLNNKQAILDVLDRFTDDLSAMKDAIAKGDGPALHETFTRVRAIRRALEDVKTTN